MNFDGSTSWPRLAFTNERPLAMELKVRIVRLRSNAYRAHCPGLPGCIVFGLSRNEVSAKIRQAIDGYLKGLDVLLPRELARQSQQETPSRGVA